MQRWKWANKEGKKVNYPLGIKHIDTLFQNNNEALHRYYTIVFQDFLVCNKIEIHFPSSFYCFVRTFSSFTYFNKELQTTVIKQQFFSNICNVGTSSASTVDTLLQINYYILQNNCQRYPFFILLQESFKPKFACTLKNFQSHFAEECHTFTIGYR